MFTLDNTHSALINVNSGSEILSWLLALPLIGAFCIMLIPRENEKLAKVIGLSFSLITFILSLFLWISFDSSTAKFQFTQELAWIPFSNIHIYLGLDGISLFFILLTTFLVPTCLLVGWSSVKVHVKEYFIAFLVLETCMLAVFAILDLLLFYVFFESVLIPMFIIIGVWGSRERKIRAAYHFFLYTLI